MSSIFRHEMRAKGAVVLDELYLIRMTEHYTASGSTFAHHVQCEYSLKCEYGLDINL